MRFTRIRVLNFRILEDIDVDLDDSLVFLNGNNGHGKTSFQSAVGWCLYGERELPNLEPGEGIISELVLKKSSSNSVFPFSVEIDLDFPEQRSTVNLKREVQWNVEQERAVPATEKFVVRVSPRDKASATEVIAPGDSWIQQWLPFRFKNFFLFDGEQMSEFFDSKTRLAVKDAVEEIARVDLFLELKKRYEGIASSYESQRSRLGASGAQSAFKELENAKKLLQITQNELAGQLDALKRDKKELESVKKALGNVEGAKTILEKIEQLEVDLREAKAKSKIVKQRFEDVTIAKGMHIQLAQAYEAITIQVEKAKAEGWYPIPFDIDAMEELLSDGKCLCGTDLHKEQFAHERLVQHIEQRRVAGELGKSLQDIHSQVQVVTGQFQYGSELVQGASNDLDLAEQQVQIIDNSLKTLRAEVSALLADLSIDEANNLAAKEQSLSAQLQVNDQKITQTAEKDIPRMQEALDKARKNYEKLTKQDDESEKLQQKKRLAEGLARAAEAVYRHAVEKVREALQEEISKNFNRIMGGDEFKTEIDAEFTVKTLTESGKPASLSSGQNMLKGYVLTVAMRQVVGLYFPLLVDTPLGRLSEEFREELGTLLTEFVESMDESADSQIIFLMHSGEYTPYTQDRFSSLKPKELYFQWAVPKKQSIIGKGVNPEWSNFTAWADRKAGKI